MTVEPSANLNAEGDGPSETKPGEADLSAVTMDMAGVDMATGEADLSAMTFDQRLEYLAAKDASLVRSDDDDEYEVDFVGVKAYTEDPETQFWKPQFWKLAREDFKELRYPTRESIIQTVIITQIVFFVVLAFVCVFDSYVEATVRTVVQGKPFVVTMDMLLKKQR
jgi:preprotein translocase subunit SecE